MAGKRKRRFLSFDNVLPDSLTMCFDHSHQVELDCSGAGSHSREQNLGCYTAIIVAMVVHSNNYESRYG